MFSVLIEIFKTFLDYLHKTILYYLMHRVKQADHKQQSNHTTADKVEDDFSGGGNYFSLWSFLPSASLDQSLDGRRFIEKLL